CARRAYSGRTWNRFDVW
nr:immunoglobulin heavy chain junction region [Macaca mulatta]MOY19988.1 immunoglobulin heavy chain junction region [Macaca mulatta]